MNNPKIDIKNTEVLSDNWYTYRKIIYDFHKQFGDEETHDGEAYGRGNRATIFLYNKEAKTVILTRQFRLPTYDNGNSSGMLIEACSGLLDQDNPEDCIKKETEEETNYKFKDVEKIFESYMSPPSVTEIPYFFVAQYDGTMKVGDGGGLQNEQENIEVLELPSDQAYSMISTGEIKDGKTIMLLQFAKINKLV